MKKAIVFVLCGVMSLSFMACSHDDAAQIPNPFAEYATLEEAIQNVGFDMTVPDSVDDMKQSVILADKDGRLIEVVYTADDESLSIRKAESNEDISGDYTKYAEVNTVEIENNKVTMKGNGEKVSVATWTDDSYSYSITNDFGMSKTAVSDLVKAVADPFTEY